MHKLFISLIVLLVGHVLITAAEPTPSAREALKPFNQFVGKWRGTGEPEGTREEKARHFWTETISWEWQFKGNDVWMQLLCPDGKYFLQGELRWLPDRKTYRLEALTNDKEKVSFEGSLEGKRLTLEREDTVKKESQRLVFSLLHDNRYLYRYEVRKEGTPIFAKQYQVGVTKQGKPFASSGDGYPECVVSGGRGTMAVTYQGKTYYVCCSGCRDEFRSNPEKYVREYEAKLKEKKP